MLAWLSVWSKVQMICIWFSWWHCHPIISNLVKYKSATSLARLSWKNVIKRLLCCFCFSRLDTLKTHERHVHSSTADELTQDENVKLECAVCSKRFIRSSELVRHRRIHSGEKPYKCYLCDKAFNHSGHLNAHIRVHTGEKPYKCPLCNKSFRQSSRLHEHRLCVHSNPADELKQGENVKFDCTVCRKQHDDD